MGENFPDIKSETGYLPIAVYMR